MSDPIVRIQGAGPVGMMAALFLLRFGWDRQAIEILDPAPAHPTPAHRNDPRVLALSPGTIARLSQLEIPLDATRIRCIHVSSQGRIGSMEIRNQNAGVPELGGLAGYAGLVDAMRTKLDSAGVAIRSGKADGDADDEPITDHDGAAKRQPAAVRIVAEGGVYRAGQAVEPGVELVRDYHQQAVLGWVDTTQPPGDTAWERFTPDGALALLPLGQRYALIWCRHHDGAAEFEAASPEMQALMIERAMGGRIGGVRDVRITARYPLGLLWREHIVEGDTVWIGNSAQTLHPIAGQGLNLGLRDAEVLAACLMQRGRPIIERLLDYAQRRRADRWAVRTATDTLARRAWVRHAIGGVAMVPGARKLLGQVLMFGG